MTKETLKKAFDWLFHRELKEEDIAFQYFLEDKINSLSNDEVLWWYSDYNNDSGPLYELWKDFTYEGKRANCGVGHKCGIKISKNEIKVKNGYGENYIRL